jgi:hypothetical protein
MNTFAARTRKQVIDENFKAFEQILPQILIAHGGKVALLRDRQIEDVFATSSEAIREGKLRFPDKMFSIQKVERQEPIHLGWFSYANH